MGEHTEQPAVTSATAPSAVARFAVSFVREKVVTVIDSTQPSGKGQGLYPPCEVLAYSWRSASMGLSLAALFAG